MHEDYLNVERARRGCAVFLIGGLLLELAGAVLIFTGRRELGVIVAVAGILTWLVTRSIGSKRYTALCAELRVKYGLGMRDAVRQDSKALQAEIPLFPLLPEEFGANKPLLLHAFKGRWQSMNAMVAEMTVVYQPQPRTNQYLSGTLLSIETPCAAPGLLAIYGQPYGGVSLNKWEGMSPVDTGDRGFLMLAKTGTEVSEYILDAFAAFGRDKETTAIVWTEANHVFVLLPIQFYSGHWTLFRYMPEAAVEAAPLPALEDLPKLIKKLS